MFSRFDRKKSFFSANFFFFLSIVAFSQGVSDTPIVLTDFCHPQYGSKSSDVPELMIYGARAKTLGILTYLEDLKLEWLDGAVNQIKATVTTPFGVYDRSSKIIKGDKEINLKSEKMTVDGVGFVADTERKNILILSNVKVVLTGDLDSEEKKTISKLEKTNKKD